MPSLESIEAHGSFILTIILVIFAMLSYFRPPQPRILDEMGADRVSAPATRGRVTFFWRNIPRRTLIAGALAMIFGVYTFYAIDKLGSVPGPSGPPGPATADPRVDAMNNALTAIAKIMLLENDFPDFKKQAASYNKFVQGILENYKRPNFTPSGPIVKYDRVAQPLQDIARDIGTIDLPLKPDAEQGGRPVEGEDQIANPPAKWEYHNLSVQHQRNVNALKTACEKFITEIRENRLAVQRYAINRLDKNVAPKPGQTDEPIRRSTNSVVNLSCNDLFQ